MKSFVVCWKKQGSLFEPWRSRAAKVSHKVSGLVLKNDTALMRMMMMVMMMVMRFCNL